MKAPIRFLAVAVLAVTVNAGALLASAAAQDVPGAPDMPVISRYEGSHLVAWKDEGFASEELPTAYDRDGGRWKKSMTVEGAPAPRLHGAGGPRGPRGPAQLRSRTGCSRGRAGARVCGRHLQLPGERHQERLRKRNERPVVVVPAHRFAFHIVNDGNVLDHAVFKVTRAGRISYVTVLTVQGAREGTGTVIDIVSPKAMESGKVRVLDAQALADGLRAEGKMAVYGVTFDTGKADIKPESQPQLAEMAKLLKAQPALKVFIVGHTDNVGQLEANLALSQRRAEAIVAALRRDFAIAADRLQARGVANFAPVASNAGEEGRSRNRRVELVVQ